MTDVPPRDDSAQPEEPDEAHLVEPQSDEQADERGKDQPGKDQPGKDQPGKDQPGRTSGHQGVGSSSGMGFGGPGPIGRGAGDRPGDPFAGLFSQLLGGGIDPAQLAAAGIPADPAMLSQVLSQVQRMLSTSGAGPVNWDLAADLARQTTAQAGDPSVGSTAAREVKEALGLAETWLDGVTDLPASSATAQAWSRAEWVEATLPIWRRLAEPVATSVADAMAGAIAQQAPEELKAVLSSAGAMMRQVGGAVFGMQVGQAVGNLACEVLSSNDIGLPLSSGGTALLPTNVAAFGEGLEVPPSELRLYLALREAAHARLFAHVPWLRAHLLGTVEAYAAGISIDTDVIERTVREIDPTDPEALQTALSGGLFEPRRTDAQQAALDHLETALALVEGWVDEVVDAAARHQLPSAAALRETMRRRRAAGGPAEHTLASLVGLELRPRRLREAARLWNTLEQARGIAGRDGVWSHPDLLPTAADLDDPTSFAARRGDDEAATADVDAAIEALLSDAGSGQGSDAGPRTAREGDDDRPGDDR